MWQFAQSVREIADACRAFGTPVTGGNVSFYNESGSSAIWPTPVIGMIGLIEDHRLAVRGAFTGNGSWIYLLGETFAELGGSEFAEVVLDSVAGPPRSISTRTRLTGADRGRPHRLLRARDDRRGDLDRARESAIKVASACRDVRGTEGAVGMFYEWPSESWSRRRPSGATRRGCQAVEAGVVHRLGETAGPGRVRGRIETRGRDRGRVRGGDPQLLAGERSRRRRDGVARAELGASGKRG